MRVSNYLEENYIFTGIAAETKEDVIREMIKKISERDEKFKENSELIENAVMKREQSLSTSMGDGVAIPHARVDEYDDFMVAIGVTKKEIECSTIYHKNDKVKFFFLVVCNSSKNRVILKVVPAIQLLFRNSILNSELHTLENISGEEILKIIKKYEQEISEGIEAEDVMRTDIKPASLDDTLADVAVRMVKEDIESIPVLDEKGKFAGDITEEELIMFGLPKSASFVKDLSFVRNSSQFEEYFKHEKDVKIREIHDLFPITTVTRNTSVVEVSFLMVYNKITRIYVVEDGKYYGTIFRGDIIKKVLHI